MPDEIQISRQDGLAAIELHEDVVAVYRSVFTRPPFNDSEQEVGWFAEEFVGDVRHPEFRCFTARCGRDVVGFAYGFRTNRTYQTLENLIPRPRRGKSSL
jgi:hypothetical protein